MASFSIYSSKPCFEGSTIVSSRRNDLKTISCKSSFFGPGIRPKPCFLVSGMKARRTHLDPNEKSGLNRVVAGAYSFDVVIVGAGIIGLTIAREFLSGSDLSVAVVDKAVPCSGATGAGQGYIWMTHKKPGSAIWDLAMRSHNLWQMLAKDISENGQDPEEVLGWKKTGSLLIGKTHDECIMLEKKVEELSKAGLDAKYLSSGDLFREEPALEVGDDAGGALLPDDGQLDAHRTVSYILKGNRSFVSKGRYQEFYHDPAVGLLRSGSGEEVEAVQTSNNILYGRRAVIVATGCWSGSVMQELLKDSDVPVNVPVKPRKGHLIVIENFNHFYLNHGLMEVGYADHQGITLDETSSATGSAELGQMLSVSMTATLDTSGNLVLGSSREFAGFNTKPNEAIISYIWDRAGDFFPKLRELSLEGLIRNRRVRVGLRPYMPDGKPMIGPVPGLSNLFLAAGHEGGGLSMALGTAEMVVDMVLGNPTHVDAAPFSVRGRCP